MNALWVFTIVVLSFVGPVLGTGPILFTELNYSSKFHFIVPCRNYLTTLNICNKYINNFYLNTLVPNGYRRLDDMILPETFFHPNSTRNAVNSADLIWPKGRIPYVIDNSLCKKHVKSH